MKVRRINVCNAYVLKTLRRRPKETSVEVFEVYGKQDPAVWLDDVEKWPSPVIHHVIDLSSDKVERKARKFYYRAKPEHYLSYASESSLDPAIQATFQSVAPELKVMKKLRDHALQSLTEGRFGIARQCLQNLEAVTKSKRYRSSNVTVHRIATKYAQWCIREIRTCKAVLTTVFPDDVQEQLARIRRAEKENIRGYRACGKIKANFVRP